MSTSLKTGQGDAGYGPGLFVDNIDDQPRIGHTGGSLGFTAANEYFPRQDTQIIAFTNSVSSPEPGETITTAIFEDLNSAIAAAAMRPSPGEDPAMTAKIETYFPQLQAVIERRLTSLPGSTRRWERVWPSASLTNSKAMVDPPPLFSRAGTPTRA